MQVHPTIYEVWEGVARLGLTLHAVLCSQREVVQKDRILERKDEQLTEKDDQLEQSVALLAQKDDQLDEKDALLVQKYEEVADN